MEIAILSMKLDLTFPHQYEIEELFELPSGTGEHKRFYFPGGVEEGGRDGLLIKVSPQVGMPWLGIFAFGYNSPNVVTGIYACPNSISVCVVSAGQGYIVRTDDPHVWEEVIAYPILDVRSLHMSKLLIFSDFTEIVAYGLGGMVWKTSRLSSDGLKIIEATPDYIRGLAWDAPQQQEVEFLIDVRTGRHEGGSNNLTKKDN
jgi:hypothetical protein